MVQRTTLVLNDASKAVEVGCSSSGSKLGSKAVSADSGHSDLPLVHEADNVVSHILHIIGCMVIRLSLVAVVQKPDIANIQHLVLTLREEWGEVFSRLGELGEPDHSWQVGLATL